MISELEKTLNDGLKSLIEKSFGKNLEDYEPHKKTEVFLIVYKTLALLLERDFDPIVDLQIANITLDKSKAEENVNFTSEGETQPTS